MKEKFNDSIFWKSYLYYENRSGSVHLFVCPFVCNATSFSILDRMGQQMYLWNPHVKSQVLRHFWSNSEEKQKSLPFCPHHLSIYLYYENSSGSVRLFVCPYVRTSSTFLDLIRLAQKRYLWIPYKKGAGSLRSWIFRVFYGLWFNFLKATLFNHLHPSWQHFFFEAMCIAPKRIWKDVYEYDIKILSRMRVKLYNLGIQIWYI